ncbi:MAG TPA: hypothetical protein DD856_07280 [Sulfobacillus sp.]|nr:hypothetical protein [Sulfobacillus sp.]
MGVIGAISHRDDMLKVIDVAHFVFADMNENGRNAGNPANGINVSMSRGGQNVNLNLPGKILEAHCHRLTYAPIGGQRSVQVKHHMFIVFQADAWNIYVYCHKELPLLFGFGTVLFSLTQQILTIAK